MIDGVASGVRGPEFIIPAPAVRLGQSLLLIPQFVHL